ncbi:MAG: hypothetical protein V8S98_05570 [Lachnospiraceae bacterium]
MVSGVMELDGRIYYLGSPDSGRMETGTIRVNGRNYTFGENGEATDYKKPSAEKTFQNREKCRWNLVGQRNDISKILYR